MEDYLKKIDENKFCKKVFDSLDIKDFLLVYHGERNIFATRECSNEMYEISIRRLI